MQTNYYAISGYYKSRPLPYIAQFASVSAWCYIKSRRLSNRELKQFILKHQLEQGCKPSFSSDSIDVFDRQSVELRIEYHNEFILLLAIGYESNAYESYFELGENFITAISVKFSGKIVAQCDIAFTEVKGEKTDSKRLLEYFGNDQYIGSNVYQNAALVWTSFSHGISTDRNKFLIEDFELGDRRRGRLIQDLVEMNFYKHLAEVASPMVEKLSQRISHLESKLLRLTNKLSKANDTQKQKVLLAELLEISMKTEWWQNLTGHRFSATEAYINMFDDRLLSLEGTKIEGYQTLISFFKKITAPTFRTYQSTNEKLLVLIKRTDRAINLLNTRIRVSVEAQNNELLRSSNLQTKQQVVLQETIEAFALVAICYNGNALIQLFLDSLVAQGVEINEPLVTSILIPIFCIISYLLMKILKRKNNKKFT